MRLPDEYDDNQGMSPIMMTTLVAVIIFAAVIVIFILSDDGGNGKKNSVVSSSAALFPSVIEQESQPKEESKLTPEDLDFWSMFAESSSSVKQPEPESSSEEPAVLDDPSTDGKHTLVQYKDGTEEWVLISPYLPKHSYDYTKLVCQSNLMKYYVNNKQASYVGIDISKNEETVDFARLKKAGIQFVMIRVGARGYGSGQLVPDDMFEENIKKAAEAGLEIGVYFSSQAVTEEEAVEEANMVIEKLADYTVTYPVAFDMGFVINDTARIDKLTRAQKTTITKTFLDTVEAAGYKSMICGDKEWLIKEIDMSKLTAYDVWLSQIADLPDYPYRFTMWQYMTDADVDGIDKSVNLNICFVDYREK